VADWLELELAESLPPVEAPDELWTRIRFAAGSSAERRPALRRPFPLMLAAAALLLGAAWLALPGTERQPRVRPATPTASQSCSLCHTTL